MSQNALLVESLVEATGITRPRIAAFLESVEGAFGSRTDALRQRVGGIMAQSWGLEERFNAVRSITEASLEGHVRSRLFAALGMGFMGGFVLAGATTLLATIVGIVLIVMAGYMIKDVVRIAMDQVGDSILLF